MPRARMATAPAAPIVNGLIEVSALLNPPPRPLSAPRRTPRLLPNHPQIAVNLAQRPRRVVTSVQQDADLVFVHCRPLRFWGFSRWEIGDQPQRSGAVRRPGV